PIFADARAVAARRGLGWWTRSAFSLDPAGADDAGGADVAPVAASADDDATTFTIAARDVESYRGDVARALDDVQGLQKAGWRLVLTTEGHGPAKRMVEQLGAADTPARLVPRLDDEPEGGIVLVTPAIDRKSTRLNSS